MLCVNMLLAGNPAAAIRQFLRTCSNGASDGGRTLNVALLMPHMSLSISQTAALSLLLCLNDSD